MPYAQYSKTSVRWESPQQFMSRICRNQVVYKMLMDFHGRLSLHYSRLPFCTPEAWHRHARSLWRYETHEGAEHTVYISLPASIYCMSLASSSPAFLLGMGNSEGEFQAQGHMPYCDKGTPNPKSELLRNNSQWEQWILCLNKVFRIVLHIYLEQKH